MSDNIIKKILIILMYIFIILLIPIFLDFLSRLTIRNKRRVQIKFLAEKKAKKTGKPLVIFNSPTDGVIIHPDGSKEKFNGEINNIINNINENTFVIIISEVFEYINKPGELFENAKLASGGDLYILGFEKNSVRSLFDYKIKNILDRPFYLPSSDTIKWTYPNQLQKKIQKIYYYLFKILPYDTIMDNPMETAK